MTSNRSCSQVSAQALWMELNCGCVMFDLRGHSVREGSIDSVTRSQSESGSPLFCGLLKHLQLKTMNLYIKSLSPRLGMDQSA